MKEITIFQLFKSLGWKICLTYLAWATICLGSMPLSLFYGARGRVISFFVIILLGITGYLIYRMAIEKVKKVYPDYPIYKVAWRRREKDG